MRLSALTDAALDVLRAAATQASDLATPTVRLGVTGLSRSGKTVFITALVRALTEGRADPALPTGVLPGFRAWLDPQPDQDVPRFAYEEHLARLAADPPEWPDGTRRISQLRVTLSWQGEDWARRTVGLDRRLHLDIIDYPGEWLIDLAMLDRTFAQWSRERLEEARAPERAGRAAEWLAFCASLDPAAAADEQVALRGAALFARYLAAERDASAGATPIGPGRFLMPGDLEGSPLLTFFPLCDERPADAVASRAKPAAGSLAAFLEGRYDSYRRQVVQPFFERHFRRLDRQIVLVDVLGALNRGSDALAELERAMEGVLATMRPGSGSWLARLIGRRTDRILFAATKADHVNRTNHARLEAILAHAVGRASKRAEAAGSGIETRAIAALRATADVDLRRGEPMSLVKGVPLPGERVGRETFDGRRAAAIFTGDLPANPLDAINPGELAPGALTFPRFRPPRILPERGGEGASAWPHIGLDEAVRFLLADHIT